MARKSNGADAQVKEDVRILAPAYARVQQHKRAAMANRLNRGDRFQKSRERAQIAPAHVGASYAADRILNAKHLAPPVRESQVSRDAPPRAKLRAASRGWRGR